MRGVVQRVSRAEVRVDGRSIGRIAGGIVLLLGIHRDDSLADASYIINKTVELRIFPDESGKMNRTLKDVGGELLIVSQFTLYGDCRRGRRPSFTEAMAPGQAQVFYDDILALARQSGIRVASGEFQAMMDVELINDGPVTILLDSQKQF